MQTLRSFARDSSYTQPHKRKINLLAEKSKELGKSLIYTSDNLQQEVDLLEFVMQHLMIQKLLKV